MPAPPRSVHRYGGALRGWRPVDDPRECSPAVDVPPLFLRRFWPSAQFFVYLKSLEDSYRSRKNIDRPIWVGITRERTRFGSLAGRGVGVGALVLRRVPGRSGADCERQRASMPPFLGLCANGVLSLRSHRSKGDHPRPAHLRNRETLLQPPPDRRRRGALRKGSGTAPRWLRSSTAALTRRPC